MTFFPSLGKNAVLFNVFKRFPNTVKPLLEYHEILLRGESPLSPAERELIAAYVSAKNKCHYCTGVHAATAEALGMPEGILVRLLDDIDMADVDERLKPILRYVGKLTEQPDGMTQADADAVYAAGWSEQALHDAVSVCALFNFMNRFVEGLGIAGDPKYFAEAAARMRDTGYVGLMKMLALK